MQDQILLATIQDILDVEDDANFEQILTELPDDLRALRRLSKQPGHVGFSWPIPWRKEGSASTITTMCLDGCVLPRPLKS